MRNADDYFGFGKCRSAMHFSNEMFDHLFSNIKIGNHAFAHGANGFNTAGGAPQHQFCVLADGQNFFQPIFDMIGDHRGL